MGPAAPPAAGEPARHAPRVLVVSHLYPSARRPHDAPWLAEQVRALAGTGVQVEVLCPSPAEPGGDAVERTRGVRVPVTYRSTSAGPLDGTRAGLALSTMRYDARLRAFLAGRRGGFDLLHAHFGFPDAYVACRVGASLGMPVVVTLHGSDVHAVLARPGALGARVRRALSSARALVCVSEDLAGAVRAAMPDHPAVMMIPNGYDDTLFAPGRDDAPRSGGFLFVGALRPVKNIQLLLEVYLSDSRLRALPLTIVGDGPLRAELESRAAASPAGAGVRFTGVLPREDVAALMGAAHALVLPSEREGYGMVAAEALACGTPVVGSAVGGLPGILAGEAAGVLVPPGDRGALERAMLAVSAWPHPRSAVAAASGARPWRERVGALAELYARVLEDGAAR